MEDIFETNRCVKGIEGMNQESDYHVSQIVPDEAVERLGMDAFFYQEKISDAIFTRIKGKSFADGCTTKREDLRYIRVLYRDFAGESRVGELIGNKNVSEDFLYIFKELYKQDYPIEKMRLVDDYDADDEASAADNNTSCFNYRIAIGGTKLSYHAYGAAIDVNPKYNPYLILDDGIMVFLSPENGGDYVDRGKDFPHKIDEEDLCYRLFTERGFSWGGTWVRNPDYMHFSKWEISE